MYLPPLQYRIWDIVRRSGTGIRLDALVDRAYADDSEGGPAFAKQSVYVSIHKLNERLKKINQRVVCKGSVCRLETIKQSANG